VQVVRIFTDKSISLSLSSRQHADRYTFHAGRNLPDKEFRYLRTVIVTAAVHRGFGCKLHQNAWNAYNSVLSSSKNNTRAIGSC